MNTLHRVRMAWVAAAFAGLCITGAAEAEYNIFAINGPAEELLLSEAMAAAGAVSIGVESFATSTYVPIVDDVWGPLPGYTENGGGLIPGYPNGPLFPVGLAAEPGIEIWSNAIDGLIWPFQGYDLAIYDTNPALTGNSVRVVGTLSVSDSLDIIVDSEQKGLVRGLAFDVVGGEVEIRIYDHLHRLLAVETHASAARLSRIAVTSVGPLFRINVLGMVSEPAVGNLEVFAIPEPAASGVIAGVVVLSLLGIRRRVAFWSGKNRG